MPVVLRIESVIGESLREVTDRFGSSAVRCTEQEGREGTAAGEGGNAGHGSLKETERSLPGDVLLSKTISALAFKSVAKFHGMSAANIADIIFERPGWLLGSVIRSAAPPGEFGEGRSEEH